VSARVDACIHCTHARLDTCIKHKTRVSFVIFSLKDSSRHARKLSKVLTTSNEHPRVSPPEKVFKDTTRCYTTCPYVVDTATFHRVQPDASRTRSTTAACALRHTTAHRGRSTREASCRYVRLNDDTESNRTRARRDERRMRAAT